MKCFQNIMSLIAGTAVSTNPLSFKIRMGNAPRKSSDVVCFVWCVVAALMMLAMSPGAAVASSDLEVSGSPASPWSIELKTRYFFNSHTSYEFGNPFPPYQAPLSRLEFPLDSWWVGGEARRRFSRFSLGFEVLRNVTIETGGAMKDSDWDDEYNPNALTIYSESGCRLEPSYNIRGDMDFNIADQIGLPDWLELRPLTGIRWQRFTFVTHDGLQTYPASGGAEPTPLPGDSIRFEQTYWQYLVGIRSACDLGNFSILPQLKLLFQIDWAYVQGYNEDHHLLRVGNRITTETTRGDAWHSSVGLKWRLTQSLDAGIEADYLKLQTTGSHRLTNDLFGIDMGFDNGVKVWSEQRSLSFSLKYSF